MVASKSEIPKLPVDKVRPDTLELLLSEQRKTNELLTALLEMFIEEEYQGDDDTSVARYMDGSYV